MNGATAYVLYVFCVQFLYVFCVQFLYVLCVQFLYAFCVQHLVQDRRLGQRVLDAQTLHR